MMVVMVIISERDVQSFKKPLTFHLKYILIYFVRMHYFKYGCCMFECGIQMRENEITQTIIMMLKLHTPAVFNSLAH